jgi:hypothetical protein
VLNTKELQKFSSELRKPPAGLRESWQGLITLIASFAVTVLLLGATTAEAKKPEMPDSALATWNAFEGPWAADVFKWADAREDGCYNFDTRDLDPCPFSHLITEAKGYPSDVTDAPEFVFVDLGYPAQGGNAYLVERVIFARQADGQYKFKTELNTLIGTDLKVSEPGPVLTITSTTLKPGEPRCCPTGQTVWRLDLASGEVSHVSGDKP